MDEVTQQNAALVEQSAAAAESMEEQARSLVEAVSVFNLGVAIAAAVPAGGNPEPGDRRGVDRARNVSRIAPSVAANRIAASKTAVRTQVANGNEEWTEF
jgi:hypothetical protein